MRDWLANRIAQIVYFKNNGLLDYITVIWKYVDFYIWQEIQKINFPLKQIYSYMHKK